MHKFILPLAALLVSGISFFLLLRDREKCPVRKDGAADPEQLRKAEKPMLIYSAAAVLAVAALSIALPGMFPDNTVMENLKRILLLAAIWPVAYIDLRTYRIPNAFVLLGLACRAVLLPFELLMDDGTVRYTLISEGVAAAALFLASVLCAVAAKGSIGFGDIKMFVVIGLLLGMDGSWGAVFTALVISLIAAVFLLATKRKGRKDTIPFGPAIVMGTFISVCLTGM